MPRQTKLTSGIKRGVGQDAATGRDIGDTTVRPPPGQVLENPPPPSREASQSSSKVGVQKHARDASPEGVNIQGARGGSKSKKKG